MAASDTNLSSLLSYISLLDKKSPTKLDSFTDFEKIEQAAAGGGNENLLLGIIDPLKNELIGKAATYAALGRVAPQQFIPNFYPKV